jgi:hypothetical protein
MQYMYEKFYGKDAKKGNFFNQSEFRKMSIRLKPEKTVNKS